MGRDFAGVYNILENNCMCTKQVLVQRLQILKWRDGYDHADIREKK